jgi:hypothetical protein
VLARRNAETAARRGPKRRAKTDRSDAQLLRDLLFEGRIPESWIPPQPVLEARALVRLYKDLLDERTGWLQRVHAGLFHSGAPDLDVKTMSAAGGNASPPWSCPRPAVVATNEHPTLHDHVQDGPGSRGWSGAVGQHAPYIVGRFIASGRAHRTTSFQAL